MLLSDPQNSMYWEGAAGEGLHRLWTTSLPSQAQVTCLLRELPLAVYYSPSYLTLDLDNRLSLWVWSSLLTDQEVALNIRCLLWVEHACLRGQVVLYCLQPLHSEMPVWAIETAEIAHFPEGFAWESHSWRRLFNTVIWCEQMQS